MHNLKDAPVVFENSPEGPYCKLVHGNTVGKPHCCASRASSERACLCVYVYVCVVCVCVFVAFAAWSQYRPEIGYCSFLDALLPDEAPHSMYACYAREWSVVTLSKLYGHLVDKHGVDAILMFDGGSDSLMRGDEKDLGDPIEDVSLTPQSC